MPDLQPPVNEHDQIHRIQGQGFAMSGKGTPLWSPLVR